MSLEVAWRLMFRVNDGVAAGRCLARVSDLLSVQIAETPMPYWKMPELWEVSFRSPFAMPVSAGVLELLLSANRLASGWLVSGPIMECEALALFEGVFDAQQGRTHVAGLSWGSFSVGHFPLGSTELR